jgi:hypothetical protein
VRALCQISSEESFARFDLDQITRLPLQPSDNMDALLWVSGSDFRKAIVEDLLLSAPSESHINFAAASLSSKLIA